MRHLRHWTDDKMILGKEKSESTTCAIKYLDDKSKESAGDIPRDIDYACN